MLLLCGHVLLVMVSLVSSYPNSGQFTRLDQRLGMEPEVYMNATQLITSKGYPCENHYVVTDDGYILNVLRIAHGRSGPPPSPTPDRPVILLQHGLLSDATAWISNPVNESLAFILADAGADVWLGNNRGNDYSLNHTHLTPADMEFWDFSFDEMARFDLPAMVYHALNVSGAKQMYYAGHSQGTTQAFVKFSEDQEFGKLIKQFFALAPVARVGEASSPLYKLAPFARSFYAIFGRGHLAIEPEWLKLLQGDLCQKWGFPTVCENILFVMMGFDREAMNITRLPVYMSHIPSGTSVKNQLHWAQLVNSKSFRRYDFYSAEENMKHYNQTTPPLYQPGKSRVPVYAFRGGNDWMSDPKDCAWLLPQLNLTKEVFIKEYEHLDFIYGMDAATKIYKEMVDVMFQK